MSQEVAEIRNLAFCKCANCRQLLRNPVQLTACLHILCSKCVNDMENAVSGNIRCPQCRQENARPSDLQRISGVNESFRLDVPCDNSASHGGATWNCFNCGQNLCIQCRASHPKDHSILQLLAHPVNLDQIFSHVDDAPARPIEETDETDSQDGAATSAPARIWQLCPKCGVANCSHMTLLSDLLTIPNESASRCQVGGHVDCNGQPQELKYFCRKCWIPVCGDCSERGQHKLHETLALSSVGEFIQKSLAEQKKRLEMLFQTCTQDVKEEQLVESRLSQHVQDVANEMTDRKRIILEETARAFERAVHKAEEEGRDILRRYKNTLKEIEKFRDLIKRVLEAVNNIQVDERFDVARYVSAFYRQRQATELINSIDRELQGLPQPVEHRLVLPDVKTLSIEPPPLARVAVEQKHLELDFTLSLKKIDFSFFSSVVAIDDEACLLACRRSRGQSDDDAIVLFSKNADPLEFDVPQGRYFITRMKSGEVVASYTSRSYGNSVRSCDGEVFEKKDNRRRVLFDREIRPFDFPPYGIAATMDNNILLCCNADEKKGLSYLMLMTQHGKVLKDTTQVSKTMISPNYVAVSDTGEICACDTEGSTVYILNQELEIKERMNYRLPTSLTDVGSLGQGEFAQERAFKPQGVCYDSYGRIIVADASNNCVVRLVRDSQTHSYKMEPLLTKPDEWSTFRFPQLVALKNGRLWVVCQEHIFVYKYCT